MPEVRIGIVTWNTGECIGACLDALPGALGDLDAEIVVVDNASSDDSADIAAAHPGVRVERNTENLGYAKAMNQALRDRPGDGPAAYLIAVNPDTVCPPGSLRALVEYLRTNPDVGLVAPRLLNADATLQHSVHRFPSVLEASVMGFVPPPARPGWIGEHWWLEGVAGAAHERVEDIDWAIGAIHCMRASAVEGLGPYNERWFMYIEDLDLCWQVHERGYRVVLAGSVPIMHIGNVAGEKAWGAAREERWLDAMYDWYERERGMRALRVWSVVNFVAAITKLAVIHSLGLLRASAARQAKRDQQRRLLQFNVAYHSRKFRESFRSRRAAHRANVHDARHDAPRLVAINASGMVSGAEIVLLRQLEAARDAGWSVRCACPRGPLVRELARRGIPRLRIPDLKLGGDRGVRRGSSIARALVRSALAARRLRRADPPADLVLCNALNALPAVRFAKLDAPCVWLAHDVLVRGDRLALLRFGAPAVDLAIAVSDAVAVPLRNAGVPAAVVHNGVAWPVAPATPAPVAMRPADGAPPVIGCVALLTPWKGQDVLLEAVSRMQTAYVDVELIGGSFPSDAAYVARLHERAEQPDLRGRVRFTGALADPLERVRTWAVSVSASVDPEAGPLTAIESMSVGVPVVATQHGGVVEVLDGAGILVPPHDVEALAHALDRMLTDEALRRRCANAGRRIVPERRLTIADQQREVLALLDRALGVSGCRRVPNAPEPPRPHAASA